MVCFVVFDVVIVLQSLVLYGLYPYVLDQLDAALEVSSCAGVSIHHYHGQWRCECHVVSSLQVKTLDLSVVAESSEWEKHLVENVVPVLACLKNGAGIKVVSVERRSASRKGNCCLSRFGYPISRGGGYRTYCVRGDSTSVLSRIRRFGSLEHPGILPCEIDAVSARAFPGPDA